jgi:hypothetical protein
MNARSRTGNAGCQELQASDAPGQCPRVRRVRIRTSPGPAPVLSLLRRHIAAVDRLHRRARTLPLSAGRPAGLPMNRLPKVMDCGGMTPLFLHRKDFQSVPSIHRAAKAESCLRSPRFRFMVPMRFQNWRWKLLMKARPRLFPAAPPAVANLPLATARQPVVLGADDNTIGFLFRPGPAPSTSPARGRVGRMASRKLSHRWLTRSLGPLLNPDPPSRELLFPIA